MSSLLLRLCFYRQTVLRDRSLEYKLHKMLVSVGVVARRVGIVDAGGVIDRIDRILIARFNICARRQFQGQFYR